MSIKAGTVDIEIAATSDGLKTAVNSAMRDVEQAVGAMQKYLALIGAGAFGEFAHSLIDGTAALKHMSEESGMSVESMSALRSTAKLTGTDMDLVVSGAQKLSKALVEAKNPTSAQADVFKQLGIDIRDTNGHLKSSDDIMLEVAKAQAGFKDGTEKTASMMVLFGKAGANLLPLLNDLAERGNLNGKVTAEQAEAAEHFEKQIIAMKTQMEAFMRNALLPLLPYLSTMGELFKDAAILGAAYFAVMAGGPAVMRLATAALAVYRDMQMMVNLVAIEGATAMELLNYSVVSIGPSFAMLATQFGVMQTALMTGAGILAAAFAGWEIGSWLRENFVEAKLAGIAFVEGLLVGWETIKYGAEVAWLGIKTAFNVAIGAIGSVFASTLDLIASGMEKVGAGSKAEGIRNFAESLRAGSDAAANFSKDQAALKLEYDASVDAIKSVTGAMANDAIAEENAKHAVEAHTAAKKDLSIKDKDVLDAEGKLQKKIADLIQSLKDEEKMLGMTSVQADIYKKQKEAGVDANSAQGQEIARLVTHLDDEKERLKLVKDWQDANAKAVKDHNDALEGQTQKLREKQAAAEMELTNFGLSKTQIEQNTLARMKETLAIQEAAIATSNVCDQRWLDVQAMREQVNAQAGIVAAMSSTDVLIATKAQADDTLKAWQDASRDIEKSLTDSLVHGFDKGKSLTQSLVDYITKAFEANVIKVLVQPVMGVLGSIFAPNATAGDGSGSGILSQLSAGKTIWDIANGGFVALQNAVSDQIMMAGLKLSEGGYGGAGGFLSSNAGNIGYGTSLLAGAAGGKLLGSAISGGYGIDGHGSAVVNIGTAIGAIWGPLGAALGGAIGGLINRTFGHGPKEIQESGIQGYFGAGSFAGQTYAQWHQEGGLFTSDKNGTDMGSLPTEVQSLLNQGSKAVLDAVTNLATALQLPVDSLGSITTSIKVKLTGNAADDQKVIEDVLTSYQDALVNSFGSVLAPFQQAGETIYQTLARVAEVQVDRQMLNQFGGIFSAIAVSGVGATQAMIDLAGGLDKLIAKAQSFVQNYYSADEQAGITARSIMSALSAVGLDASALSSKSEFRALLESLNASKPGDQAQINALLDMAPQFAQIAQALGDEHLTLGSLANLAPALANLPSLFATTADNTAAAASAAATTDAINAVSDSVDTGTTAVVSAINDMSANVTQGVTDAVAAAVSAASSVSDAAVLALYSKLDSIDANSRLYAAAPGM